MEYVWYSPERDEIVVSTKESGFLFKDEYGEFHLLYHIGCNCCQHKPFNVKPYYLIGEL